MSQTKVPRDPEPSHQHGIYREEVGSRLASNFLHDDCVRCASSGLKSSAYQILIVASSGVSSIHITGLDAELGKRKTVESGGTRPTPRQLTD